MSLTDQASVFIWTLLIGIAAGMSYEFYRVAARILKLKRVGIFTGDIVYWIFITALVFVMLLYVNRGQLRFYVFLGLFLGVFIYFRLASRYFNILVNGFFYVLDRIIKMLFALACLVFRIVLFPFRVVLAIFALPLRALGFAYRSLLRLTGRPQRFVRFRIARVFSYVRRLLNGIAPRE